MTYVPPGVIIETNLNPKLVTLNDLDRVPAVIGLGPTAFSVVDEAVVRSSGSGANNFDKLAVAQNQFVAISRISNLPGQTASSPYDYTSGIFHDITSPQTTAKSIINLSVSGSNTPTSTVQLVTGNVLSSISIYAGATNPTGKFSYATGVPVWAGVQESGSSGLRLRYTTSGSSGADFSAGTVSIYDKGASSNNGFRVYAPEVITGNAGDYDLFISQDGSTYSGSSVAAGTLARSATDGKSAAYWDSQASSASQYPNTGPTVGEIYYVSYSYNPPTDQYDPIILTSVSDVTTRFGAESTANTLTVGAKLVLENGALAVICVQQRGVGYDANNFQDALNKLEKIPNVNYIVPVYRSNYTSGQISDVITKITAHVDSQSTATFGRNRATLVGLGASNSVDTYINKALAVHDRRVSLVFPGDSVTRAGNDSLVLDGSYLSAAIAGAISSLDSPVNSVTGKALTGITIPDNQFSPFDYNRLAGNGVLVVTANSGVIRVRHALTTDTASAETEEISVVAGSDLVVRKLKKALQDTYINRGITITTEVVQDIAETIKSVLESMRVAQEIADWGKKYDPKTGELPVQALQDSSEPRQVRVTLSIKFAYPLNWIRVQVFSFV